MSDELFDIPPTPVPRLVAARARYAAAKAAWDECMEMDNSPVRSRIGGELGRAEDELEAAERIALKGDA